MSDPYNTPWRLTAVSIYQRPRDARVFGHMDIEVGPALAFIARRREEGVRLTLTHLVASAVARSLAEDVPELNCYIRRGSVRPRKDVGIMLAVDGGDENLAALVVRRAHTRTVTELAEEIGRRSEGKRKLEGRSDRKNWLGRIPWPLRGLAFAGLRFVVYEGGLELGGLGSESFGSALITNIGSFGLNSGFAALLPASNLPIVVALGRAEPRAVVRDGQIVVRDVLPISGTFDHRLVDGRQAGKLSQAVQRWLADPEGLDRLPGASG